MHNSNSQQVPMLLTSPDSMTPTQRAAEVAAILTGAILRMVNSQESATKSQVCLANSGHQSVHVLPPKKGRKS